MYKIAVLPGDGTGPEVVDEGLKVLNAVSEKVGFKYETTAFDFGGDRYLRTNEVLPESAVDDLRQFDTIYLGAIGAMQLMIATLGEDKGAQIVEDAIVETLGKLEDMGAGKMGYSISQVGDLVAQSVADA